MAAPIVVLDACVLYPAPLRDFFMHLAVAGLVQARWTDLIHEEWINALLNRRPDLSRERLEHVSALMDLHAPDAKVHGFEPLVGTFGLPDPGDEHILAAAVTAGATQIVTFNLSDFPSQLLIVHRVVAVHPDELVLRLLQADIEAVASVFRTHRLSLSRPPLTSQELLQKLRKSGLAASCMSLQSVFHLL